ncbi:ankyrin repeat domain-containing protein [Brachyspira intermedia]|uniref:ankyrin repeat domain-containing protein n=1 Tax=Brachyspira intermedia TaxID=84377 RepID=UPI003006D725
MTELLEAIKNDDLETLKSLIEKGADINAKDDSNITALMLASEKGHLEVAEFLKANGAV